MKRLDKLDVILIISIITMALILFSRVAFSYPENIRFGYPSCMSCHVSPSGGGVLTPYGRTASAEFMAVFAWKGAESTTLGLSEDSELVYFGGDARYLFRYANDEQRPVFMQADLEAAINVSEQIKIVRSVGIYNIPTDYSRELPKLEETRKYLLLTPNKFIAARIGKFVRSYGFMIQDHTANIRQGINQPEETAELGIYSPFGEIVGSDKSARATAYLWKGSVVGASYLPDRYGVFSFITLPFGLFTMDQVDFLDDRKIVYSKIGAQLAKGVLLSGGMQDRRWFVELQLFPIPHAELFFSIAENDLRALLHWNI